MNTYYQMMNNYWLSFLDFCNAQSCADCPRDNVLAERYDVSEFFIKSPRGLPIEMKGVAV